MELLIVTARWPHSMVKEFMDDEIVHLARRFDRIVVAPMSPDATGVLPVPKGVVADLSLAEHLVGCRLLGAKHARSVTGALRVIRHSRGGRGAKFDEFVRDGLSPAWIRRFLLARADATSVAQWAAKRKPPDIAYTFWLGAETVGLRVGWPRVPLVSRAHSHELFSEYYGLESLPFQREAIRAADRVASVSEMGSTYLAQKFPEYSEKVVCRRLGIADFRGLAVPSESGKLRLMSASSMRAAKRVFLIAEVAVALAESGRNVEWTHFGDGAGRDAVFKAIMGAPESFSARLRGQVPTEEVRRALASGACDVFINLSLTEGAPVSLMEAQCAGIPVVATAICGTPEVVSAEFNELVGTEASIDELCAAVLRAAARPDWERQSRRQWWMDRFNEDVNYSQWATELLQMASKGTAS